MLSGAVQAVCLIEPTAMAGYLPVAVEVHSGSSLEFRLKPARSLGHSSSEAN